MQYHLLDLCSSPAQEESNALIAPTTLRSPRASQSLVMLNVAQLAANPQVCVEAFPKNDGIRERIPRLEGEESLTFHGSFASTNDWLKLRE